MSDKMLEAFEKWGMSRALDLRMDKDAWGQDRYYHSHIYAMWTAWQAALPPGFEAVPVEPTDEMVEAGISAASLNGAEGTDEQLRGDVTGAYAAMIAARPDKQP